MRYTDYERVRLLAKSILTDDKKIIALVEGLCGSLKQLRASFLDDGYNEIEAYANGLMRKLASAQDSFLVLAKELLEYADILESAMGTKSDLNSALSCGFKAEYVQESTQQHSFAPKELERLRTAAVKAAWEHETVCVRNGRGTRDWTVAQQAELLQYGTISGFEGQHMKNVADFPQFAGDPNNIQFLTPQEHFYGGHEGKWKNKSNGRLDLSTGQIIQFAEDELPSIPEIELSDKYDESQFELTERLGRSFGYGRRKDSRQSRERIVKGNKQQGG